MKSANVKSSSTSFGVVPPANFSYLEENICRCTYPITRHNLNFVQSTNLNYIVNLSGRKHDQAVLTFFEEKNIEVKLLLQDGESPPFTPLAALDAWIASSIETLLSKSCENSILLVGGVDTFYDCLIIACLRRLQEWSYVSILAEFRQHTWPHKLFDFEQVIENFNPALVNLPANIPEFLSIHDNFKDEEYKLLHKLNQSTPVAHAHSASLDAEESSFQLDSPLPTPRAAAVAEETVGSADQIENTAEKVKVKQLEEEHQLEVKASNDQSKESLSVVEDESKAGAPLLSDNATPAATAPGPEEATATTSLSAEVPLQNEQDRIDSILKMLFFGPKNQLISEGTVFDPSISLINEKDEED